ncbi:MAG: tryptophan 7-halogenase [Elusimicrobia bacterium]|nr:tryptophan 7-halogenase [Elusimicrobiota bacterium]
MKPWDLVVVGAGPAGCTVATLAKKYAPERRILLLEKSPGPRHHIGESLLPGLVPVLKEMGVFEKVDAAGFPRKIGANYLWGRGREVWENDFNDVNVGEMLRRHGSLPEKIEYAWQVRRSLYDDILLRHAEENGVEVRRGAAALKIIENEGRITGLTISTGSGLPEPVYAGLLADCSGQSGFLSRFRKIRSYNPALKNVAGYAYFRGADWKYRFTGHPDKTKIFICATEAGWFWYIPISTDIVSVGLVAGAGAPRRRGISLRELYFSELKKCREIWPLLKNAQLERDFDGAGRDFFVQSDWSYLNEAASGPGWLAAGDAAVFVDPILSSGVTLAHLGAHRAAYTALAHWREESSEMRSLLWRDYDTFCRESAAQFLSLALFWYGNDRRAESWWARARRIQRAWLPVELGDQNAFIAVSAGLTRHYERALSAASALEPEPVAPGDYPFYAAVLGRDSALEALAREGLSENCRPRLSCPYEVEYSFIPDWGRGRLLAAKRARFLKHDPAEGLGDCFNPRRAVARHHLELLKDLDGRKSWRQIKEGLPARGVPSWWAEGPAANFVRELRLQGVLEA